MTSESCVMMNFLQERNFANAFRITVTSMLTPLTAISNTVSSRGLFQHVELQCSQGCSL